MENALKNGKLTAVYVDRNNTERFLVGLVASLRNPDVLMVTFDSESAPNNICFCCIDSIYRIEQESIYLRKMQNKLSQTDHSSPEFGSPPWNSFLSQIQSARDHSIRCYLKTGEVMQGVLMSYSDNAIMLTQTNDKVPGNLVCIDRMEIAALIHD